MPLHESLHMNSHAMPIHILVFFFSNRKVNQDPKELTTQDRKKSEEKWKIQLKGEKNVILPVSVRGNHVDDNQITTNVRTIFESLRIISKQNICAICTKMSFQKNCSLILFSRFSEHLETSQNDVPHCIFSWRTIMLRHYSDRFNWFSHDKWKRERRDKKRFLLVEWMEQQHYNHQVQARVDLKEKLKNESHSNGFVCFKNTNFVSINTIYLSWACGYRCIVLFSSFSLLSLSIFSHIQIHKIKSASELRLWVNMLEKLLLT